MIVAEGLAENFAEKMFGQENIGYPLAECSYAF